MAKPEDEKREPERTKMVPGQTPLGSVRPMMVSEGDYFNYVSGDTSRTHQQMNMLIDIGHRTVSMLAAINATLEKMRLDVAAMRPVDPDPNTLFGPIFGEKP